MNEYSAGRSPPLAQGPRCRWIQKYATAISPETMNAAGRVNRPSMMRSPPTLSNTPAKPNRERAISPAQFAAASRYRSIARGLFGFRAFQAD